ncbi:MAG TPA: methyltransferase domain-containing protein [Longimicrobiales bacterium]
MRSPEERDPRVPDIVAGRRVRRVDVEPVPGMELFVLEAADPEIVLDETAQATGDAYAAILWPSALAAAARLPDLVRRRDTVLDLGAGTGLVALTAARLGARAEALEHDPFARAVIAEAARLQRLRVTVIDGDIAADATFPDADLVVMADLLYEPELARTAARRALELLARGTRVLVTDPGRFSRTTFERALHDAGVRVEFEDILVRVPLEPQPSRVGVALIEPRP